MNIKIKKLTKNAKVPFYASEGAACFDLSCTETVEWNMTKITNCEEGTVHENCYLVSAILGTGLAFEIPEEYRMDIYPRSGWSFKHNIQLANGTGKIDSDYRGEVKVKLIGFIPTDEIEKFKETFSFEDKIGIQAGTRIAQAEINPVIQANFIETEELSSTERGEDGFGSTGH